MPAREIVVVGGGPAGLVTALEARRRGLEPLVLDRRRPPIDKACGEGLMPDGVSRLAELGVRIDPAQSRAFQGIRYLDGEIVAEARFSSGPGLGVRRTRLHEALARRAEQAGIDIWWGVAARGLIKEGVDTDRGPVSAAWVVGADGLNSRVRRWAELGERQGPRLRFGVRRHYRMEPWSDLVEVYWGDGCEAYVTPIAPGEVGVALLWSGEKSSFDRLLGKFSALAERLRGVEVTSRDRGAGPLAQRPRRVYRGRVALVGDAAGYLDAITGEGLSLAFHEAQALVGAICEDDLSGYARSCKRLAAVPFALIRALLLAERHPALRRRLIHTLASDTKLFERLVALHAREISLREVGADGAIRLLTGLLRPGVAALRVG